MARKQRKPGDEKPKRRPQCPSDLPDRRAMEGMMHQHVAGVQGHANDDTPLGKAQALIYRAFEEPHGPRRVRLANSVLAGPYDPDRRDSITIAPAPRAAIPVRRSRRDG